MFARKLCLVLIISFLFDMSVPSRARILFRLTTKAEWTIALQFGPQLKFGKLKIVAAERVENNYLNRCICTLSPSVIPFC